MLFDFLLPSPCVVCGHLPKPLCGACQPIGGFHIEHSAGSNLYFSNELAGDFEAIMQSYKDKSRIALENTLASLLESLVLKIATYEYFDCYALPPRNQSNFRRRGYVPIERLTRKTSLAKIERVFLSKTRNIRDQRRLSMPARLTNTAHAFQAVSGSGKVLLVDDVATTGATLQEMRRALESAGYQVVASCVLARRFGSEFDSKHFQRSLEPGLSPDRR